MPLPAKFKLGFLHHAAGDARIVMTDYQSGDKGIFLSRPFGTREEVLEEFAAIERAIAKAKAKALQIVTPEEQGVKSAQRVFAKILKKADPVTPKAQQR